MNAKTLTRGLRPRHVPQRTCVGCRTEQAKRELIRIVRSPEGRVAVDPSGKRPGRGAYLHLSGVCWQNGVRKQRLARALHTDISQEDYIALEQWMHAALKEPVDGR